jgi:hypothetical protein
MAQTMEIPVMQLRIGQTLTDSAGRGNTVIKQFDPCTQPGKIHVNRTMCYDLIAFARIKVSDA